MTAPEMEPLLTPSEVAAMWNVNAETVRRWGIAGKLTVIRTPGGQRRYSSAENRAPLAGGRS